jgi:HEAT repeat protein
MLVRSSRQTIGRVVTDLGRGVLLGGMGLPANTADLREHEGRIIEKPLAGTLDELLALIEKSNLPDLDRLAASAEAVTLDPDVVKRSGQITRLRALVSTDAFEPRLIAVKALARVRELDNVPILIYALTDPDLRIVREADQGLRFISRKFDGVGLPAEPKPADVKAAIAAWKAWYRSIRPNAEFLD